jgi:hypothetical protein
VGVTDAASQSAVQPLALTINAAPTPPPSTGIGRLSGWCMDGNYTVTVPGGSAPSANRFMRSFPSCTVTVFNAGTTTPATIFADANGTARANPFTAAASGQWFFFAATGGAYDVRLSGGGIPAPFTLGSMSPAGVPGGFSGTLNVQGASGPCTITFTNGIITASTCH